MFSNIKSIIFILGIFTTFTNMKFELLKEEYIMTIKLITLQKSLTWGIVHEICLPMNILEKLNRTTKA
jgi:hypothetical protein